MKTLRCLIALAAVLGGCAAGPEFTAPALPVSSGYTPHAGPAATASAPVAHGAAQTFAVGQAIRADWWALFKSPALNTLIEKALVANPSIEAAQASLRVAQESALAQRGYFYPTVAASYSPQRTKLAGNQGGNSPGVQGDGSVIAVQQGTPANAGGAAPFNSPVIYNFHTAQLTVGYAPDVFGANLRQVQGLDALAQAQAHQLQAAYLTLASNVVAAALQEALLRQQIATTQAIVEGGRQAVDVLRRQLTAGYASRVDLALQENALAQSQQALPPLRKQLEQTRNLLRALVGGMQDVELPETFELAQLSLPEELPLSLPSQLVSQRPDMRVAEAQLQAATAAVGVAAANRLPQFSINASWGGAAGSFSQMFSNSGRFFNLAAGITQPIFDAGTLKHRERAAEEGLRQAQALYQATAITAFQNVADTLAAIESDAQALVAAASAERTSRKSLDLVQRQLAKGYIDRLTLLAAEQSHHQAALALAQAQAARLGDTAALFQALGGGWWQGDGPTDSRAAAR